MSHQDCTDGNPCKVDCVRKLTLSLQLCTLDMAVILKENLHNEIWWLSMFYSLCIHSVVRKVLIILAMEAGDSTDSKCPNAHDHLRLASRLFIAISGRYDFLYQDQSMALPSTPTISSEYDISRIEEIKAAAQFVVKQPAWPKLGFSCSADFLKHIFEDKELGQYDENGDSGGGLDAGKFSVRPKPYVPGCSDVDSYRQFRVDWDTARCNHTKHIVSIGTRHGWLSELYVRTAKKWARIEVAWRKYHEVILANVLKTKKLPVSNGTKFDSLLESHDEQRSQEEHLHTPPIYASIEQNCEYTTADLRAGDNRPQKQFPRFDGDLYWPPMIRGPEDSVQEGWCGMCPAPGRWLPLDGAFQDDKDFNHGVSAVTGKPFDEPKEVRRMKEDPSIWWGLCDTCGEWVELLGSNQETAWFVHSFGVSRDTSQDAHIWCLTDCIQCYT